MDWYEDRLAAATQRLSMPKGVSRPTRLVTHTPSTPLTVRSSPASFEVAIWEPPQLLFFQAGPGVALLPGLMHSDGSTRDPRRLESCPGRLSG